MCIFRIILNLHIRQFDIPDKAVIYNYSLNWILARTFSFKHINMVNKFSKKRCAQLIHLHKFAYWSYEIFILQIVTFQALDFEA